MSLVRLIPAKTDIEDMRKLRKKEVARATKTENASPKLNDNGCECKAYVGCPFTEKDIGKMPEGGTTFTMREIMETQACYIPMVKDNYKCSKIHVFAIMGTARESDFMDLLHAEPDSVNCRDSAGNTPLMLACVARNVSLKVIKTLLKRLLTEDVNFNNEDELTALHFAVLNNHPELVEKLIANGANINAGSRKVGSKRYGLTPLLMSVICNRTDENRCLGVLLKYDPYLNVEAVQETYGDTNSLHFHNECDCGGCKLRVSSSGCFVPPSKIKAVEWEPVGSAVYLATLNNLPTNLSTLLSAYDEDERRYAMFEKEVCLYPLNLCEMAIRNMNIDTLKVLIETESSIVNTMMDNYNGYSYAAPLHIVLMRKRCFEGCFFCPFCGNKLTLNPRKVMEVLNLLLDCPVIDVNTRIGSEPWHTPLLMAVDNGHDYAIEKLLNRGADPLAVDGNGHTAVDLALEQEPDICLKILKVLFKTGLSHEICYGQSFDNSLTLRKVSEKKDIDILTLFRKAGALSESNRVAMYNAVLATGVEEKEREKKEQFLRTLKTADPFPLQQIVQTYLSAQAGIQSPQTRQEAVKQVLQKYMSRNDNTNQTSNHIEKENAIGKRRHAAKRKAKKQKTSPKNKRQKFNNLSVITNNCQEENVSTESCSSDDQDGHLDHPSGIVQDLLHFNLHDIGVTPE